MNWKGFWLIVAFGALLLAVLVALFLLVPDTPDRVVRPDR